MMYKSLKNITDFVFAFILLLSLLPIFFLIFVLTSISTKSFGIYKQERIGYKCKPFYIYKFKTMHDIANNSDFITSGNDIRITFIGKFLRRYKLDELPQLFNIVKGEMSFVGPRPDVNTYTSSLTFQDQYLYKVKPGITSEASLYFKDEEIILSQVVDKNFYNDNVIWPIKLRLNINYAKSVNFSTDIVIILKTIGILFYKKYPDQILF